MFIQTIVNEAHTDKIARKNINRSYEERVSRIILRTRDLKFQIHSFEFVVAAAFPNSISGLTYACTREMLLPI